jgi:hypothetical protein
VPTGPLCARASVAECRRAATERNSVGAPLLCEVLSAENGDAPLQRSRINCGRAICVLKHPSKFPVPSQLAPQSACYSCYTMDGCCKSKIRRREHAAAVVCALSLFVALVAGSALRPHFTTNALPVPGASIGHVALHDVRQARAVGVKEYVIAGAHARPSPAARKPFQYVWMTHDLPSTWAPLSPRLDWSALPKSFVGAVFLARGAPGAAFLANAGQRHTPTRFTILRC